ncbi:DUF7305 domain-containing protein [Chamaesiphon minutus]|uniref:DUF7305 domain-containing protein n=1 Tax=Chamaesiphon minutus (strain ATCC 27169 / PCC 6605) TaxID=1173020 RepID=K9UL42_CHAP6|nr:hypothetical protein [Chamaesiphon minutus]AFY95550.1 hypothetical protein Cha6605_4632 [Chamaesiphon minutus PCC 6605]
MIKYYLRTYLRCYLALIEPCTDRISKATHRLDRQSLSQSGFSVPLALGLGLVMIIVAASIIGRSQSDRDITSSQREINRALSVSEAGALRFQSFLDRHKLLATKNLAQWVNTLDTLPTSQAGCHSIDLPIARYQAVLFKDSTWIELDPSDRNKGRYQIVDYRYQNGVGKLTIAGRIDAYNTTENTANSTLKIDIPIGSESAKIAPPALWANTFNLNANQKVTGQIRGVSCPLLPMMDSDGIAGIDMSNIALISGIPSGQIIADPFVSIPAPKIAPTIATSIPAITTSIELPRPTSADTPDAKGEYHYLVDTDVPGGNSIKLQDSDLIKITIPATQKINLYLKGNIDLAGSQTIGVNSANPNLRIYGSNQTVKLTIKDNASITAFIHAPLADAKSISSTTPNPSQNITGAVWVNSWDSSASSSPIPIVQMGNWSDFGIAKIEQPSQLSPISYWQRIEN